MKENSNKSGSSEEREMYEHYRLKVDQGQSSVRIDKYLSGRIENASRSRIQSAAEAGNIIVNEKAVKASYKVKAGDDIRILMDYPRRELKIIPEDLPLNIVYEDSELAVINKAPGMVVHPGHGNYTGTLVNALAWHYKDLP
ncbi:MAG: S4 domain-containing protein, partial [Prolixibacteraceae bacterium]|nr:S4 domain-containing protein [Prolixibacteraceae bacterium]